MSAFSSDKQQRLRLEYVDGVRGLAALFVVLHHAWTGTLVGQKNLFLWQQFAQILSYGHYAVAIFIVLSGFLLMLPVVSSKEGRLPNGFFPYLKKRARRIIPAYYAALTISILLSLFVPGLKNERDRWGNADTLSFNFPHAQFPGAVLSHLVLVHNLNPIWIFRFDAPMWSVATEWQIYFIFPLLLLPLWRKFGSVVPILAGLMIGIITAQFGSLEGARFLYIGLFAMGMAGAAVSFGAHAEENAKAYPWKAIWAFLSVLAVAGIIVIDGLYADMLVGLATTALLIYLTLHLRYNAHASQPAVLRILSAPSAVKLGSFSYSLYLTHFPLQTIFLVLLIPYHFPRTHEFVVLTALGTPIILLFAYGFYLVFERPFLFSSHVRHNS